jgi:hypothetical protein
MKGPPRAGTRTDPDVNGELTTRASGARRRGGRVALAIGGLVAFLVARAGHADSAAVPADVQAALLSKLERYDRNFPTRSGELARVLIVVKPGNAKSDRSAEEMKSALGRLANIGGLPHKELVHDFNGADGLAARCRSDHVAVVYFTPGFDSELGDIRTALGKLDVLSLAASPEYVSQGIVLGFELEAGAPKILFNLEQARKQHVDLPASVLRLMKVYR